MQNVQRIVLVDFGAQYTQLIARRVREAKVFCEVVSYLTPLSEILEKKPVGIILSGGPASVLDADAPHIDRPSTSRASRFWASATACRSRTCRPQIGRGSHPEGV